MASGNDGDLGQVVAMQFAGGMSIAALAEAWEREPAWVEAAVRVALLETIPERDGGLKVPRSTTQAERREETALAREMQSELFTE